MDGFVGMVVTCIERPRRIKLYFLRAGLILQESETDFAVCQHDSLTAKLFFQLRAQLHLCKLSWVKQLAAIILLWDERSQTPSSQHYL